MTGTPCASCARYRSELTCDAFPDGIPRVIWFAGLHDKPFPGDHGLQYDPIPGFENDF